MIQLLLAMCVRVFVQACVSAPVFNLLLDCLVIPIILDTRILFAYLRGYRVGLRGRFVGVDIAVLGTYTKMHLISEVKTWSPVNFKRTNVLL